MLTRRRCIANQDFGGFGQTHGLYSFRNFQYLDSSKAASDDLHSDAVHIASISVRVGSGGSVSRRMASRANSLMNKVFKYVCVVSMVLHLHCLRAARKTHCKRTRVSELAP